MNKVDNIQQQMGHVSKEVEILRTKKIYTSSEIFSQK